MSFSELGLSEKVLAAVADTGYTKPTPIQAQAIPEVLARRDVLGIAQTGTGKTAAFTLPMLTLLEQGRARARMPRTLILEPTRELAAQVEENFTRYGKNHKLNVALLIGGVSFGDQDSKLLRGVDVLIATPGRLLDHVERGRLLLSGIEVLVIDEADRMLDMGFIPDIERICKLVPFTRQTLFFSATMPPEIQRLVSQFLSNPVRIEVSKPASTATTVTQLLVASGKEDWEKRDVLRNLIRSSENLQNGIIFCNRKRDVAVLHRSLQKHGFNAVALHGDMDQHARLKALDQFRNGEAKLLVASDVAARGLDIPEVSHVFNYDVPHHAEDYVHRIGRTGRAGRTGTAYSIVTHADAKSLASIEKLIGNAIPWHGEPLGEAPPREKRESREGREDGRLRGKRRVEKDARSEPRREREKEPRRQREKEPRTEEPRTEEPRAERPRRPQREEVAEARPPRRERQPANEPADMSHLPAFLLRPVRVKAS
ncbi:MULTISPECIES: DEAD/DEAH box helicase [unclassified Xanthobacter]|uniref:DEAD/DEAH box helicase n=1 Tax=unclassified Xanthobacter TaxID=2623496 RepID=UPI001EDD12C0|nr:MULTISPECIES: DEAD/DEAH box helicase [unclassified Xanthobacter]